MKKLLIAATVLAALFWYGNQKTPVQSDPVTERDTASL